MTEYVLYDGEVYKASFTWNELIAIESCNDVHRGLMVDTSDCTPLDPLEAFAILAQQETKS